MLELLKNLISIFAYWFDPRVRRRREKERLWNKMRGLEDLYGIALSEGDPKAAERLHAQMNDLREKIIYLEGKGG